MTSEFKREATLFLGGAMAWHALTHLALAATKSAEPHSRLGIRMTAPRNVAAAAFWAVVSLVLTRRSRSSEAEISA